METTVLPKAKMPLEGMFGEEGWLSEEGWMSEDEYMFEEGCIFGEENEDLMLKMTKPQ